ncbi:MAG: TetR/AcrR family transcriptional regulator [Proteobacteria bacterium]|nr:TetR/AcrR family transcriptional regulator [Pseudomonadota bacterium]
MHTDKVVVRKRLDREEPQDAKRPRILEAALELFETRGFDGVAVPEIALKAGVATGTIYRYFETKEALVNALYRYWKKQYNEVVLAPPYEGATPRQTFSHYWQRMTLFARAFPRAIRFMDLHHHAAYLDAESRALSRNYASAAETFVRDARRSGDLRDLDPMMVVALMWGACAGLVKFSAQGALAFDAETAADMEEALWRAIANT